MRRVVELGGPQTYTRDIDAADGDGAGDAIDGLDYALEDSGSGGDERRKRVA